MKILVGKVVAIKSPKTVTVVVGRIVTHPVYGKKMKREKKYQVHDEMGIAKVGDSIGFAACKPVSKLKKWRIVA